jgi:phage shock protein C
MKKRIMKCSDNDSMIEGVCGGLADYFNTDPVIVRTIFALLICTYGTGGLLYFILAIVMPDYKKDKTKEVNFKE